MKKKKPEIKIDYFHVDGWKHSITFTPNEGKIHYQIMDEHSTRIIKKGELCNIKT